jgi:hypothetical protein
MRHAMLLLAVSVTCARAQPPADDRPAPDGKTEEARAKEAAVVTRKAAGSYTITLERPQGKATLRLEPEPLLQWSNPVAGSFHGTVFVWTEKGRPEVIASIYKKYVPPPHLGVEFHTLTSALVTAERGGRPEWFPEGGGVAPEPVPGAPAPAGSPAQRLRQMRDLAREFTATKTDRKDVTRPLRLLTQPIYRYAQTTPEAPDGALFAFVEGTDPELFLVIEAGRREQGAVWLYTLARMNSIALRVTHKGREVWSVPTIPWQQAFNPREPYTLLIFRPGQGVNPPEDAP